jgi:hypothetical protein
MIDMKIIKFCIIIVVILFARISHSQLVVGTTGKGYGSEDDRQYNYTVDKPMFEFKFVDGAAGYYIDDNGVDVRGNNWQFIRKSLLQSATDYCSAVLGPLPVNSKPTRIQVKVSDKESSINTTYDGAGKGTALVAALFEGKMIDGLENCQARLNIEKQSLREEFKYSLSLHGGQNLPENGQGHSFTGTIAHELWHSLGITLFNITFEEHLVDSFGKSATDFPPGYGEYRLRTREHDRGNVVLGEIQDPRGYFTIISSGSAKLNDKSQSGYAFFQSDLVRDVLNTNNNSAGTNVQHGNVYLPFNNPECIWGVPINGYELDSDIFEGRREIYKFEGSHSEVFGSFMSHQNWRNNCYFTEVEIAMIKSSLGDRGKNIDIRNLYGCSIYTNGQDHVIDKDYSFYHRENFRSVCGRPNNTPFATGLHIFGSSNTVITRQEILSSWQGHSTIGIRVDGVNNTLCLAEDNNIKLEGDRSVGLLIAYGKNHNILHKGVIDCNGGDNGVGIRIDFGTNYLGADKEYRGSYMCGRCRAGYGGGRDVIEFEHKPVPKELQGALVDRLYVSGKIKAPKAIYVSNNAYVREINLCRGAVIEGNIDYNWNHRDTRIQQQDPDGGVYFFPYDRQLTTKLSIGVKEMRDDWRNLRDIDFDAEQEADPDSVIEFSGNIVCKCNNYYNDQTLDVELKGGTLEWSPGLYSSYQKMEHLRSFKMDRDTTLLLNVAHANLHYVSNFMGTDSANMPSISADKIDIDQEAKIVVSFGERRVEGWAGDPVFVYDDRDKTVLLLEDEKRNEIKLCRIENVSLAALPEVVEIGFFDYRGLNITPRWEQGRNYFGGYDNSKRYLVLKFTQPAQQQPVRPAPLPVRSLPAPVVPAPVQPEPLPAPLPMPVVVARLSEERAAIRAISAPVIISVLASNMQECLKEVERSLSNAKETNVWVKSGLTQKNVTNSGYETSKYKVDSIEAVLCGINKKVNEKVILGIGFNYGKPNYRSNDADISVESIRAFGYGAVNLLSDVKLSLVYEVGRNKYLQNRKVYEEEYETEHSGTQYNVGLRMSREFKVTKEISIKPMISNEYVILDVEKYKEDKKGVYALDFGGNKTQTGMWTVGTEMGLKVSKYVGIEGRVFYSGIYGDRKAEVEECFLRARHVCIVGEGDLLDASSMGAGIGFTIKPKEWIKITLEDTLAKGESISSNMLSGRVCLNF